MSFMDELTVSLKEGSEVEIQDMDIGVSEEVIAFEIEGMIRGVDDDLLATVAGKTLQPTEITFELVDG